MFKDRKVFLIGIGGVSMQGIAKTLIDSGNQVSGSDLKGSQLINDLRKEGVEVSIGHDQKNITSELDLVIISNAIPESNPELEKARELDLRVISNSQAIQEILSDKKIIAISGTHGKSTISAMTSYILEKHNQEPSYYLGALSNQLKEYARYNGQGEVGVVEACEYKRAFLSYKPDLILISNIEAEHLDYFKDLEEIKKAFLKLISNLKEGGGLVVCQESKAAIEVAEKSDRNYISYGCSPKADYQVDPNLELKVFGEHNQLNALGASLAASLLVGDLSQDLAASYLEKFQGIKRRSEYLGRKGPVMVYDDYAHHPTEIKTTLKGFKDQFKNKKIFLVFQPHQLERLNSLFDDFVSSLVIADKIVVVKTFQPAGRNISKNEDFRKSLDLSMKLKESGAESYYAKDYDQANQIVKDKAISGDLVITMGAGPVYEVARNYLKIDNQ